MIVNALARVKLFTRAKKKYSSDIANHFYLDSIYNVNQKYIFCNYIHILVNSNFKNFNSSRILKSHLWHFTDIQDYPFEKENVHKSFQKLIKCPHHNSDWKSIDQIDCRTNFAVRIMSLFLNLSTHSVMFSLSNLRSLLILIINFLGQKSSFWKMSE